MRPRPFAIAVMMLSLAPLALAAQGPGGGGMGGGMEGVAGGHHGAYGHQDELEGLAIDPVVWNGPPATGDLPEAIRLTDEQRPRYDSLYNAFMAATRRVRDQAQANRQLAYGGEGHHGALPASTVGDLREESLYLSQKQDVFDAAIETFLSKDQLKEYHKWRKAQRKAAEKEEEKRHEGMRGRGSPPS
jgi:hypothetical protein